MIGNPDPPKLAHTWRCTRPPATSSIERAVDGTATVVTRCPMCGAEDRDER